MKPLTIVSSLFLVTFLTYAYLPQQDLIHNPKSIDWHSGHHAYFAKIQISKPTVISQKSSQNFKLKRVV